MTSWTYYARNWLLTSANVNYQVHVNNDPHWPQIAKAFQQTLEITYKIQLRKQTNAPTLVQTYVISSTLLAYSKTECPSP